jgi:alpha-mannosidase
LALMPCAQGWRQQAVPRQAARFREPLWLRPARGSQQAPAWTGVDLGSEALQLVAVQSVGQSGEARITVQNLSPQRQQVRWPEEWRATPEGELAPDANTLAPWQLASWRVSCAAGSPDAAQSS